MTSYELEEKRIAIFGEGRDFARGVLTEYVIAAGKFIAGITGKDPAAGAMAELVRAMSFDCPNDDGWEEALRKQDGELFWDVPIAALLIDLYGYAHHGCALQRSQTQGDTTEDNLGHLIKQVADFMAKVPFREWGLDAANVEGTLMLANGRWALDHNQPIEPKALAVFGGVSDGRIRNLMAGAGRIFTTKDGKVTASDALQWLAKRKDWYPSVWREEDIDEQYSSVSPESEEEFVFVPVARDGSVFNPKLKKDGKYEIGFKDTEQTFSSFMEALEALQKMHSAAWRRPTHLGSWTLVSALRWQRMTVKELADV